MAHAAGALGFAARDLGGGQGGERGGEGVEGVVLLGERVSLGLLFGALGVLARCAGGGGGGGGGGLGDA